MMRLRLLPVTDERRLEQCLMLARRYLSAKHHGDHLITKVTVVGRRMSGEKHVGPAGGDQGMVEVPVALFPELLILALSFQHALFHHAQLVVSRDDATLPVEAAGDDAVRGHGFRAEGEARPPG